MNQHTKTGLLKLRWPSWVIGALHSYYTDGDFQIDIRQLWANLSYSIKLQEPQFFRDSYPRIYDRYNGNSFPVFDGNKLYLDLAVDLRDSTTPNMSGPKLLSIVQPPHTFELELNSFLALDENVSLDLIAQIHHAGWEIRMYDQGQIVTHLPQSLLKIASYVHTLQPFQPIADLEAATTIHKLPTLLARFSQPASEWSRWHIARLKAEMDRINHEPA